MTAPPDLTIKQGPRPARARLGALARPERRIRPEQRDAQGGVPLSNWSTPRGHIRNDTRDVSRRIFGVRRVQATRARLTQTEMLTGCVASQTTVPTKIVTPRPSSTA
jgi:hypothetical protein